MRAIGLLAIAQHRPKLLAPMIADYETLKQLSKARGPKGVAAWLARNRIKYFVDAKGRPVTTITALDRALHRGEKDTEPNFEMPPCRNSRAG